MALEIYDGVSGDAIETVAVMSVVRKVSFFCHFLVRRTKAII